MDNMNVIGGIKAEMKTEDNVVEIGFEDLYNAKGDDKDQPFVYDDHFDSDSNPFEDDDDPFDVSCKDDKSILKKTNQIENKKSIIPEANNLSKNLTTTADDKVYKANNILTEEKLVLNYKPYEDLLDDSTKHKEVEKRLNVNIASPRTNQVVRKNYRAENQPKTKVYRSIIYVEDHEYKILGYEKVGCTHCQFVTTTKKFVKRHIINKHKDPMKMNHCQLCPFKSRYPIKYHIISCHTSESEMKWYRCDQCDYKAKLKSTLAAHIRNHMDPNQIMDKMKKCNLCPKMFKKSDSLKKHNKYVHEKNTVSKLKCTECDYECLKQFQLIHHKTICHSNLNDLKTLKCSQCSYKTKLQYRLRIHVHMRHSKDKLQCEKCAYQSASMEVMKLHMINHKAVKDEEDFKYRCDKCDYKSIRQYSLQVHMLTHLKPDEIQYFYCYHCKFKAKRKDNLKTHVLRHFKLNEVPFQCFICNFITKKRNVLIRHIDNHSKNPNDTTEQTAKVCSSVSEPSQLIKNVKNRSVDQIEEMKDLKTDVVPSNDGETETTKIISPVSKRSKRIENRKIKVSPSLVRNAKKMKDSIPNETDTPFVSKKEHIEDLKTDVAPSVDGLLKETETTKIILPIYKRSERIKNRKIKVSPSVDKKPKKMKDSIPNEIDTLSVSKKEHMEDLETDVAPSVDEPLDETESTKIISPVSKRSKRVENRKIKVSPSLEKKTKSSKLVDSDTLSVSKKEDMEDLKTDLNPYVDEPLNDRKRTIAEENHLNKTKKLKPEENQLKETNMPIVEYVNPAMTSNEMKITNPE